MIVRASLLAGAAAGLLVLASVAEAGLRVQPLRLEMRDAARVTELRVTNTRNEEGLVQVRVWRWSHAEGAMHFEEAPELVVSPPVFSLAAGAQQVVRIGRRSPQPMSSEQAYRIVVEEVPMPEIEGTGLQVVVRMILPLFVGPSGARPELDFALDGHCLRMHNRGDRHARLATVEVDSGARSAAMDLKQLPYALAGENRCLALDAIGFRPERVRYRIHDGAAHEQTLR